MTKSSRDAEILEAVWTSATKAEAAQRTGIHPCSLRTILERLGHLEDWRRLPSGNAFAGIQSRGVPRPFPKQGEVDAIFQEAAEDYPLSAERNQARNAVGLLLAAYAITGSIRFPNGWVRSAMTEFENAGLHIPTAASLRWYRSKLSSDPYHFEDMPRVNQQLLQDLAETTGLYR